MSIRHQSHIVIVLAAAALFSACADPASPPPPSPPVPGFLTVRVTSPAPDDQSLLFEVSGPGITQVQAVEGTGTTLHSRLVNNTLRAAIFGTLPATAVVRFHVPDVGAVATYSGRVVEAAGPTNVLREALTGYRVDIVR